MLPCNERWFAPHFRDDKGRPREVRLSAEGHSSRKGWNFPFTQAVPFWSFWGVTLVQTQSEVFWVEQLSGECNTGEVKVHFKNWVTTLVTSFTSQMIFCHSSHSLFCLETWVSVSGPTLQPSVPSFLLWGALVPFIFKPNSIYHKRELDLG